MLGNKWTKFWNDFETTMNGLGPAIEEAVEEAVTSGNGQSVTNVNGNVDIRGKLRSLSINGKKIDLGIYTPEGLAKSAKLQRYYDRLEGLMRNVIARRGSVPADLYDMAKELNKWPI